MIDFQPYDTALAGQSLANADLRGHDLTNKILFQTDLRGAQLYNARISLTCSTFDGLRLDSEQVAVLLKLIALADVDERWIVGINSLVASVTSPAKLRVIDRYLQIHM